MACSQDVKDSRDMRKMRLVAMLLCMAVLPFAVCRAQEPSETSEIRTFSNSGCSTATSIAR